MPERESTDAGAQRQEFAFIVGHMRSGSSLLLHLLASNPQIAAIGETHLSYRSLNDIGRLQRRIAETLGPQAAGRRFVLDKLLQPYIALASEVLSAPTGRFLFLTRSPDESMASMIAAFPDWFTGKPLPHDELVRKAGAYYLARLKLMAQTAARVGDRSRCLSLDYEELLGRTDASFAAIERLLNLAHPLREEYQLLPGTARPRLGDTSEEIRRG
ncbi:MAG: hypothetical protein KDA41_17465, partial [Planctomycetales bacterium]|nr:hypothetical protein [Planctomycetales bacterium]